MRFVSGCVRGLLPVFLGLVLLAAPARAVELYQVSTIEALTAGLYSPEGSFADLARHGDFGLGTFVDLDGEMVALDGAFYQVKSDGTVHVVPPTAKTPFAEVVFFKGAVDLGRVDGLDLDGLKAALAARAARSGPVLRGAGGRDLLDADRAQRPGPDPALAHLGRGPHAPERLSLAVGPGHHGRHLRPAERAGPGPFGLALPFPDRRPDQGRPRPWRDRGQGLGPGRQRRYAVRGFPRPTPAAPRRGGPGGGHRVAGGAVSGGRRRARDSRRCGQKPASR